MHRSASWNIPKVSDDYYMHTTSPSSKGTTGMRFSSLVDENDLPVYDPVAEMNNKKEKARLKFAENAVHFIPLVLLLCAITLWFFSNPEIDVGIKSDSLAARIEGLTIEGDFDNDSDGTQTGALPIVDTAGDLNSAKDYFKKKMIPRNR